MGDDHVENGVPGGEVGPRGHSDRGPPAPARTEIDHGPERVPRQQVHLDGYVVGPVCNVEPARQGAQRLSPQDGHGRPRELEIRTEREPAAGGSHDWCASAPPVERGDGLVGRHPNLAQEREVREVTDLLLGCCTDVRGRLLEVVRGGAVVGVHDEPGCGVVRSPRCVEPGPYCPGRYAPFARCTEPALVVWHIERQFF